MVKCLKIRKKKTEKVRKFLLKKGWLDKRFELGKSGKKYTLLPLKKSAGKKTLKKKLGGKIEDRNLPKQKTKPKSLKQALKKIVPKDKIDKINTGFEAVGNIGILEIPKEVEKLEKSIAWTLKRTRKNIKTVVKKQEKTSGKFRIRKVKVLVGNGTSTIHKESGIKLKVDLNKVYFSSKMGSERLRILEQIKKSENILVMFAGVGPYPIVFAKHRPSAKVTAVELNPSAVRLFKENLKLNKISKKQVKIIKGDAKKEVPKLKQKFDRIVMVLPKRAHEFLPEALKVAKRNCKIHLYQFEREDKVKERAGEIKKTIKKLGKKVSSIKPVRSGYYSPRVNRYCYDVQLE